MNTKLTPSKGLLCAVGALSLVLVMAGCKSESSAPAGPPILKAQGVSRVQPSPDAPVAAVAEGIGAFGYELGREGVALTQNWVVSPTSIAYAFAMARAGAKGATGTEIDQAFGFPATGLHEAFNSISAQVITAEIPPPKATEGPRQPGPPKPPIVSIGNALFPQSGLAIGEEFLRTLALHYGAGVYPVDFSQPSATETIDAWVRHQTAERIHKLFDSLPPETGLVLANAIYLKADWEHSFAEEPTTDVAFHRADGTDVTVPMMHQAAQLRYAEGPGWQAVELPYAGDQLAMWVLLPTTGAAAADRKTPHELLAPALLKSMGTQLKTRSVEVSLPRWDFATSLDLKGALNRMGVVTAFGGGADFSGIHEGLFIGEAVHRANITVDEWGTEAAAVTGISFPTSAPPAPEVTFTADHPFAFVIVHTPTGVPTFMGHVADPTAKE